jgi:phage baseplate assembly protein W
MRREYGSFITMLLSALLSALLRKVIDAAIERWKKRNEPKGYV